MMQKDLLTWPEKLSTGLELAQDFWKDFGARFSKPIKKIAFVGMGGSGIAGRIIKTFLDKKISQVSVVVSGPDIPSSLDTETLAIVVSYSGNTWETIEAFEALCARHIPAIVVAHGGNLLAQAELKNLPFMIIPEALSPRSSLGYTLGMLVGVLGKMGFFDGEDLINRWINHAHVYLPKYSQQQYFNDFLEQAKDLELFHLWGVAGDSGACLYRAQTQFNENAKIQAVYSEIPELLHNLLVGFSNCKNKSLVVIASTAFVNPHLELSIEVVSEILQQKGACLYKIPVLGDTFSDQLFDIILWADFASYYLGLVKGVDVVSVKIIEQLKQTHKQKGIR